MLGTWQVKTHAGLCDRQLICRCNPLFSARGLTVATIGYSCGLAEFDYVTRRSYDRSSPPSGCRHVMSPIGTTSGGGAAAFRSFVGGSDKARISGAFSAAIHHAATLDPASTPPRLVGHRRGANNPTEASTRVLARMCKLIRFRGTSPSVT